MGRPITDLTAIIRNILQTHQTTSEAASALYEMASNDPELAKMILPANVLQDACLTAVRRVNLNARTSVYTAAMSEHRGDIHVAPVTVTNVEPSDENLTVTPKQNIAVSRFASWKRSLLDEYTISNGKKLGDATKEELFETINNLRNRAGDMIVKSDWLSRIADRLDGNNKVREQFSEKEILELQHVALTSEQIMVTS